MVSRFIFTSTFSISGSLASFAQSSDSLHNVRAGREDIAGIVGQLEQSALLALSGTVVLIAMVFVCYVWKACSGMNKPQENTRKPFLSGLLMVLGMSVFCGSCAMEKQALVTEFLKAESAQQHPCLVSHEYGNRPSYYLNFKYPNQGGADWNGYRTCKYCGQKIYNR